MEVRRRYFHSRRITGPVEKPWLDRKDPRAKWVTLLPLVGIVFGLAVSGVLVWTGWRSVIRHEYCLVFEDDFSNGLDDGVWRREVNLGGFGWVVQRGTC